MTNFPTLQENQVALARAQKAKFSATSGFVVHEVNGLFSVDIVLCSKADPVARSIIRVFNITYRSAGGSAFLYLRDLAIHVP